MAHHSRYKRIVADRIPLLDDKVFWRQFANLANRFIAGKIDVDSFVQQHHDLEAKYGDMTHGSIKHFFNTEMKSCRPS